MAIRSHLTTTLGATHLYMLNDATRDAGSSGDAVAQFSLDPISANNKFTAAPTMYGVSNCFRSNHRVDFTTFQDSGKIVNSADINVAPIAYATTQKTILFNFSSKEYYTYTSVYEEGGNVNNIMISVGLGGSISFQAAVAGDQFLIAETAWRGQDNRIYQVAGVWQHATAHAGVGNRVLLYVNGVLQKITEFADTTPFPNHNGDITLGNTSEVLKTRNEQSVASPVRGKDMNMLGLFNHIALTETQIRDLFERTVLPHIVIAADTVANQQVALDALIGNTYKDLNCAIQIRQATDATNYRLFIDNITFEQNTFIDDIAVLFIGTGTLTLENTNGSNVVVTAAPPEIDLDGTTVLAGGGSITIVENVVRLHSVINQSNLFSKKFVFEVAGTYTFNNVADATLENVSGGNVTINATGTTTITNNLSPATITINNSVTISINNCVVGKPVYVFETTTGNVLIDEIAAASTVSTVYNLTSGNVQVKIRHRVSSPSDTIKKRYTSVDTITSTGLNHNINLTNDTLAT